MDRDGEVNRDRETDKDREIETERGKKPEIKTDTETMECNAKRNQ